MADLEKLSKSKFIINNLYHQDAISAFLFEIQKVDQIVDIVKFINKTSQLKFGGDLENI